MKINTRQTPPIAKHLRLHVGEGTSTIILIVYLEYSVIYVWLTLRLHETINQCRFKNELRMHYQRV